MKKVLTLLLFSAVLTLSAGEWKNIFYYEKNFPIRGNEKVLRERCKLDIVTPEIKNFPTLVWFHGGGLSRGEKFIPSEINTGKIAVISVNYRLAGKNVRHPDYIYDAAAAVSWVLKNIQSYGGDPKKVFVSGHSAGGYLAAMIALDKKYLKTFGCAPKDVAAFYPVSGQMTTHFQILAERRQIDPDTPDFAVDEYAPLYHVSKDAPCMIFFCGDAKYDIAARVEENQLITARLKRSFKHKEVEFISIPQTGHGGCMSPALSIVNRMILKSYKLICI